MSNKNPFPYHAYLVRCWQEQAATEDEPAIWRFELQSVSDQQERRAFSSFEAMMAFLQAQLQGNKVDEN